MSCPFTDRCGDQACEFSNEKGVAGKHALCPDVCLTLPKNTGHFLAKSGPVGSREEAKKGSVEAEQHGYASFGDTRRLARRVSCFIRATSASRFCRPFGVSR